MNKNVVELKDEERTHCEIWTRVMGYSRPVTAFNKGKQSEYKDRKYFKEPCDCCSKRAKAA
ncbi:MAG: hypothetical protein II453_09330 [Alphaproteobacteria bacterium]|nr:hypothetical protein [Alphaproteobacteria bacterium]